MTVRKPHFVVHHFVAVHSVRFPLHPVGQSARLLSAMPDRQKTEWAYSRSVSEEPNPKNECVANMGVDSLDGQHGWPLPSTINSPAINERSSPHKSKNAWKADFKEASKAGK